MLTPNLYDMCGRSSITSNEQELEERFGKKFYSKDVERYDPLPNYNVCPTHTLPLVAGTQDCFMPAKWGIDLIGKNQRLHKNVINARVESIYSVPTFQESVQLRRALLPATSYFEWKTIGKQKIPYLIRPQGISIFSLAAIFVADDQDVARFVLITRPPIPVLSFIHHRMPGILLPEQESAWIDPDLSTDKALELLQIPNSTPFEYFSVDARLNASFANDPTLHHPTAHTVTEQQSLF